MQHPAAPPFPKDVDIRQGLTRELVRLYNELLALATYARDELDVDPPLLHFPILEDRPPQRP